MRLAEIVLDADDSDDDVGGDPAEIALDDGDSSSDDSSSAEDSLSEDGGASPEEVAAITEPKRTLVLTAHGAEIVSRPAPEPAAPEAAAPNA